jgi:hypothetical protein
MYALLLLALLAVPARALASGNVQAVVTDGLLEVTGDEGANVFRIAAAGPATAVVTVFEGTTVNDGLTPVTLSGVSSLRLDTGAGDDRVELLQLDLPGTLTAKLGRGVDDVILQDVRVQGKTQIKGGRDRNVVSVRGFSRFRGPLVVDLGKGADEVTLTNATISAGLRLDTGGDGDTVSLQLCALEQGGALLVRTGKGQDLVTVGGSDFFDAVQLVLGKDADDLRVQDSDFDRGFDADGGAGEDALDFDGSVTFDPQQPQRIVAFEGQS